MKRASSRRKFESWWDREAHGLHELCWSVGYPMDDRTVLHVRAGGRELTLSRKGGDPFWVGVAEQAWAMNRGLA